MPGKTRLLIETLTEELKDRDFTVEILKTSSKKYCSDILALKSARDSRIMVSLKCVIDINECTKKNVGELKKFCISTDSTPLIVGLTSRREELLSGVVYKRFGVYAVHVSTFIDALKGIKPVAFTERGGLYVSINGKNLKEARLRKGYSLGELAIRLGVSRKAIYDYEREKMNATLDVASKLGSILEENIVKPINIFEWKREKITENKLPRKSLLRGLYYNIKKLGYNVFCFSRMPFDMIAFKEKDDKKILIKVVEKNIKIEEALEEIELSRKVAEITSSN
ncbi:MAG TPA: helix-turn-helix domain-containing protein, partial [Thermoprotei archaeon]|nr:helix-turn-helix domain-containing protein [Thermoprotei archaeon]